MQIENQTIENLVSEECVEDIHYSECTFHGCRFSEMKMKNCSFDNCEFVNCTFANVQFEFCTIRNCAFTECNLIGVNWSEFQERGSIFLAAKLLRHCILKYNSFLHLKLVRSDFSGSTIHDTNFEECNLQKANFRNVNFSKSVFEKCDLREADFRDAHYYLINTNSNQVKGAKFSYPDVVNLLSTLGIIIEN